jgi:hypothetical protein
MATGCRVRGRCLDMAIAIGDELFTIACYGLSLSSYEMVLQVQWLESLGPILWDFTSHTMAFVQDGHHVIWSATSASSTPPILCAALANVMDDLLQHFVPLFEPPTGLPPPRKQVHQIRHLPGPMPVVVRPYCYAHNQKLELEKQCAEMLHTDVIRPSTSAFTTPVLLVKKGDGSWRFCVDLRALNAVTVKDISYTRGGGAVG